MMKIKLLTSLGSEKTVYLNAPLVLKTPNNRVKTLFILDTGSPHTIISYSDARRLQIPFSEKNDEIIRIGGGKYRGYSYNKLKALFISEDNKLIEENLANAKIIRPTSIKDEEEIGVFPTIIGTDFLKEKEYKLFCDFAKEDAFLEK